MIDWLVGAISWGLDQFVLMSQALSLLFKGVVAYVPHLVALGCDPENQLKWYEEWTEPEAGFENTDADRLPDSVATIGRAGYAPGPATLNGGAGQTFAWRARVDGASVTIERMMADMSGWEQEEALVAADGNIVSVSLGFTTAGDPVVACERATGVGAAPEVWVGFLNSLTQAFEFTNFGPGRSPLAFLDVPGDPSVSDVTVMYINADNTAVNYRLQRDRYEVEYEAITEAEVGVDLSLSYLILGGGTPGRSRVMGLVHDPVTGRYEESFNFFSSLVPWVVVEEPALASVSFEDLLTYVELIDYVHPVEDPASASVEFVDLDTRLVVIENTPPEDVALASVTLEALSSALVVIVYVPPEEAVLARVTLEALLTLQDTIIVPGPAYGQPEDSALASVTLEALETVVV